MATKQEEAAFQALDAVMKLYGADAFGDIVSAFDDACAKHAYRREVFAEGLTEELLDIIRQRCGTRHDRRAEIERRHAEIKRQ